MMSNASLAVDVGIFLWFGMGLESRGVDVEGR